MLNNLKRRHFILALLAMLSLVALSALSLASAAPFFPPGYNHAEHVHEHAEGAIFFEAGPIAQAGGPEQLSLAYGATPDVITVSWLTSGAGAQTIVRYGTTSGSLTKSASGAAGVAYTCGQYTSGAIHQVTLSGLAPATRYYYAVGAADASSTERSFVSSPGVGPIFPFTRACAGA